MYKMGLRYVSQVGCLLLLKTFRLKLNLIKSPYKNYYYYYYYYYYDRNGSYFTRLAISDEGDAYGM